MTFLRIVLAVVVVGFLARFIHAAFTDGPGGISPWAAVMLVVIVPAMVWGQIRRKPPH